MTLSEGESFESMLKRFNKRVQQDGILSEFRRREQAHPDHTRAGEPASYRGDSCSDRKAL